MPERIQRRRTKGWRAPEGAVYVGRGSKYGNPFRIGSLVMEPGPYNSPASPYDGFLEPGTYRWTGMGGPYDYVVRPVKDRADAVALFRAYIDFHDDTWPPDVIREELGGRDLMCWCPPGEPCHVDHLLKVANGGTDA